VIAGFLVEPSTVGPKIQKPLAKMERCGLTTSRAKPGVSFINKRMPFRELTYHIPPWTRKLIDSKNALV